MHPSTLENRPQAVPGGTRDTGHSLPDLAGSKNLLGLRPMIPGISHAATTGGRFDQITIRQLSIYDQDF